MSEGVLAGLILALEISLALMLLAGLLAWRLYSERRQSRLLGGQLLERLREGRAGRREALQAALAQNCGLDPERAEQRAQDLSALENALYVRVLNALLGYDRAAIATLDEPVDALLKGYRELAGEVSAAAVPSADLELLQKEKQALREENAGLAEELAQAKVTIDHLMEEYASLYEGSHEEAHRKLNEKLQKLRQQRGAG